MALMEIGSYSNVGTDGKGNPNGCDADIYTKQYAQQCMTEFEGHLYGVEMGICFGGGVEKIGLQWGNRGDIYGFDTFEGHPIKEMLPRDKWAQESGGEQSMAAVCMQHWYSTYGFEKCTQEYIQAELDRQNLTNVHLVKGVVTDQTDVSFIPYLNYAFLDMDWPQAQWDGYNLIKHKMVQGSYLCLHDMIKPGHIPGCYEVYQDMLAEGLFEWHWEKIEPTLLVVLRKK